MINIQSSQKVFKNKLDIFFKRNWFNACILFCLSLNFISLFNGVMEVDAALYASIAKRIAVTGDWINLFADGHDWLDKPHLPFWIIAVSFKIFGVTDFAYKLPAFVSLIAAVYFTYQLSKNIYGKQTARIIMIIFLSSLHLFLSIADVRAEAYLVTFITGAVYYIYLLYTKGRYKFIVPAALLCAAAVCTKGIFVLITISSGFVLQWIFKKDWKQFVSVKWLILLALTGVFILPELYCLYVQFDQHPEKIVFGKTSVSGIRFFFWDSQFGRFFNNGPIKGSGDILFYLHTFLWAFLPWSLLAYFSLTHFFFSFKPRLVVQIIPAGTILISFIIFSISKFQLPHYIVILFPFFSMVTGNYLLALKHQKAKTAWRTTQLIIFILVSGIVIYLGLITKFTSSLTIVILTIIFSVLVFINLVLNKNYIHQVLLTGICTASLIFIPQFIFLPCIASIPGRFKCCCLAQ